MKEWEFILLSNEADIHAHLLFFPFSYPFSAPFLALECPSISSSNIL